MTSYVVSSNLSWPFVTLRHFDLRAVDAEQLSGAELIVFSPIVGKHHKEAWEEYAWDHQGWIQEDIYYRGWGDELRPGNISKHIHPWSETSSISDIKDHAEHNRELTKYNESHFLPLWQLGPLTDDASIVNMDLETHPSFHRMVDDVLEIEHKLLSEVVDLNFLLKHTNHHTHEDNNDGHARSYILQPVFNDFLEGSRVVGFLIAVVQWESFFIDVLPEGTNGKSVTE
jgi:hypothetical protein